MLDPSNGVLGWLEEKDKDKHHSLYHSLNNRHEWTVISF